MKKYYSLFCSIFLGLIITKAQVNLPPISARTVNSSYYENLKQGDNNKTTSCIDTVRFPASRLTSIEVLDSMELGYIEGLSQAYHFTGNGLVHGISAYVTLDLDGIPDPLDSISMVISVYTITDASTVPLPGYPNKPTVLIATDTVDVFDVGFQEQALMFSTPVAVSDSFAVVLELNKLQLPARAPWYAYNNQGDGNQDKLAWAIYAGFLYNAYTDWSGLWDSDIMLSPIFEQAYTASYTVDTNSVCLGNEILFTNSSAYSTDSMFMTAPTSTILDYGDLNSSAIDTNISYEYLAAGDYSTSLTLTHNGYHLACVDVALADVTVLDTAISNYNYVGLGGGGYQFTNMSTNANTYYWDFGDGDTSNAQSPIHTFLSDNNYNVCLTVTDSNGCNVNTSCQVVSFVTAIEANDVEINEVKIYPIPANKYFSVVVPEGYRTGNVILTDIVGKTVKIEAIDNQEELKILTHEINSGIYFLTIENNGQKVYTKRIAVDKK